MMCDCVQFLSLSSIQSYPAFSLPFHLLVLFICMFISLHAVQVFFISVIPLPSMLFCSSPFPFLTFPPFYFISTFCSSFSRPFPSPYLYTYIFFFHYFLFPPSYSDSSYLGCFPGRSS
ncbi:hypothetical protein GOODEAATRI_026448 [Goodea atripinnis]|uniref:Uncharacterized protein n=1 Tax=Goodea atripinnis TaxID=208336 RepID=A0ABV0N4F7_9TELE